MCICVMYTARCHRSQGWSIFRSLRAINETENDREGHKWNEKMNSCARSHCAWLPSSNNLEESQSNLNFTIDKCSTCMLAFKSPWHNGWCAVVRAARFCPMLMMPILVAHIRSQVRVCVYIEALNCFTFNNTLTFSCPQPMPHRRHVYSVRCCDGNCFKHKKILTRFGFNAGLCHIRSSRGTMYVWNVDPCFSYCWNGRKHEKKLSFLLHAVCTEHMIKCIFVLFYYFVKRGVCAECFVSTIFVTNIATHVCRQLIHMHTDIVRFSLAKTSFHRFYPMAGRNIFYLCSRRVGCAPTTQCGQAHAHAISPCGVGGIILSIKS